MTPCRTIRSSAWRSSRGHAILCLATPRHTVQRHATPQHTTHKHARARAGVYTHLCAHLYTCLYHVPIHTWPQLEQFERLADQIVDASPMAVRTRAESPSALADGLADDAAVGQLRVLEREATQSLVELRARLVHVAAQVVTCTRVHTHVHTRWQMYELLPCMPRQLEAAWAMADPAAVRTKVCMFRFSHCCNILDIATCHLRKTKIWTRRALRTEVCLVGAPRQGYSRIDTHVLACVQTCLQTCM